MRTLRRQRAGLSEPRAPPILPRQQALTLMNSQLRAGRTDLTGVTGPALLRTIVPGEREPLTRAP